MLVVCKLHHPIIIIVQTYLKAFNYLNACQIYAAECVSKVQSILSSIVYLMHGTVCLQLTQFACNDRDNVYFILLSSSNREYESLTSVIGLSHETMVYAVCLTVFLFENIGKCQLTMPPSSGIIFVLSWYMYKIFVIRLTITASVILLPNLNMNEELRPSYITAN